MVQRVSVCGCGVGAGGFALQIRLKRCHSPGTNTIASCWLTQKEEECVEAGERVHVCVNVEIGTATRAVCVAVRQLPLCVAMGCLASQWDNYLLHHTNNQTSTTSSVFTAASKVASMFATRARAPQTNAL